MSRHSQPRYRRRRSRRGAALAASGTLAVGLALPVALTASPAAAAEPTADAPPRVTGLSNFFDYCQTGATLAVPLFYGIGTSTVNLALAQFPAEAQPVTNQVLAAEAAGPQVFEAMAEPTRQFLDGGRAAAAPLAAYNEQFNGGLTAFAEGTRAAADALGPVVQPADTSMMQFADFLESLRAK
ncbi:hypothetical protein [Sporichthya polymorpha]|uniref:hypothetical protein n=1 Tax=Sporichthya polymorpha TaxID=35751 RepID=UPI00036D854D|nr:hypothetical protein [Sporichthya polymorpha]